MCSGKKKSTTTSHYRVLQLKNGLVAKLEVETRG